MTEYEISTIRERNQSRKNAFAFMLLLCLSACGNIASFHSPDGSEPRLTDRQACQYDAEKAVAGQDNPFIARSVAIRLYDDCMTTRGYVASAD